MVSEPTSPAGVNVMPYLLVAWVALLGADRIDLLGGEADFVLTPFLALTPLYLALETVLMAVQRKRVAVPPAAAAYSLVLLLFVSVVLLSTLLGLDVLTSARRSILLLALSGGTLLVALFAIGRPTLGPALALGAELGLGLAVLFSVAQVIAFFSPEADVLRLGPVSIGLEPMAYAGIIPRLTGQVADANRAGLLFLFYLFALAQWGTPGARRRGWISVASVLILLTLSRSAIFAAMSVGLVAALSHGGGRISRGALVTTTCSVSVIAGLLLISPNLRTDVGRALAPLGTRFSLQEGSVREHARLFDRGVREATGSVRRAALGVGYGDSFLLLQDVFPGNKYGNFHSLYVTLMVESGIFALMLSLVLLGIPLISGGQLRPMMAGLLVFNLFYQVLSEPLFWFVLALAWLLLPPSVSARNDARSASPSPKRTQEAPVE